MSVKLTYLASLTRQVNMDMKTLPSTADLNTALELFHFAFRAFTLGPDEVLAELGMQRVHHRILYFVGRHPDLSVNALLRILGVTRQSLNTPLRELTSRGLILATPDSSDRRIKRLRLSETGLAFEERLSGSQRDLVASVFAELGGESEQAWRQVMTAVANTRFAALLAPQSPTSAVNPDETLSTNR